MAVSGRSWPSPQSSMSMACLSWCDLFRAIHGHQAIAWVRGWPGTDPLVFLKKKKRKENSVRSQYTHSYEMGSGETARHNQKKRVEKGPPDALWFDQNVSLSHLQDALCGCALGTYNCVLDTYTIVPWKRSIACP